MARVTAAVVAAVAVAAAAVSAEDIGKLVLDEQQRNYTGTPFDPLRWESFVLCMDEASESAGFSVRNVTEAGWRGSLRAPGWLQRTPTKSVRVRTNATNFTGRQRFRFCSISRTRRFYHDRLGANVRSFVSDDLNLNRPQGVSSSLPSTRLEISSPVTGTLITSRRADKCTYYYRTTPQDMSVLGS